MRNDSSETRGSEQSVIDQLVEAVDGGDAEGKQRLARRLLEGYARHGWHLRHVVDAGVLLTHDQLDPGLADPADVAMALEDVDVSEERIQRVLRGSEMTEPEVSAWRAHIQERTFDPELVFVGRANICIVLQVKHSDRRRAHIAIRDWDGQSGDLVAAYSTYSEAMNALRSVGIVRMDEHLAWEERTKSDSR